MFSGPPLALHRLHRPHPRLLAIAVALPLKIAMSPPGPCPASRHPTQLRAHRTVGTGVLETQQCRHWSDRCPGHTLMFLRSLDISPTLALADGKCVVFFAGACL